MRRLCWLFILTLTAQSNAVELQGFALRLPADLAQVRGSCELAFDQAFKDKEEYERQPQVSIACAVNLSGKQTAEMRESFVSDCVTTFENFASVRSAGDLVQMSVGLLAGKFDYEYGGYFRLACMDKALKQAYLQNAQREVYSPSAAIVRDSSSCSYTGCSSSAAR